MIQHQLIFYLKGFDDYFTISEPNVFTPNGDGENDEFIIGIPHKVQPCAELTIYNRWGQIPILLSWLQSKMGWNE